jgi:2-oxoglutarate dehydrogenase E1 component
MQHAGLFERFLAAKFPSSKRFGLEGIESVIPGLHMFCEKSAELGVNQMQIGMSHRGRLNVLHNLLGKPLGAVCTEMEGHQSPLRVGDVKYHLGMTVEKELCSGATMTLSLAPNPSHLEMIHPVVQGLVRALQRHR